MKRYISKKEIYQKFSMHYFIYDWVVNDPHDPKKKALAAEENDDEEDRAAGNPKRREKDTDMSLRAYTIPGNSSGAAVGTDVVRLEAYGFRPWVYLTLPEAWTRETLKTRSQEIFRSVWNLAGVHRPEECDAPWKKGSRTIQKDCWKCFRGQLSFVQRSRLYYGHSKCFGEKPWLLKMYCVSETERRRLRFKLDRKVLPGSGGHVLTVLEGEASPILQMTTERGLPTLGWVRIQVPEGSPPPVLRRDRPGAVRLRVPYEWLEYCPQIVTVPRPRVLSFDLETYSSDPTRMPSAENMEDAIFQIGVSLSPAMAGGASRKILLCLCPGGVCEERFRARFPGEHQLVLCEDEETLLHKFRELWIQENPHVVTGYNIFGFDFPYIIERCKQYDITTEFFRLGPFLDPAPIKVVNWSSSAYRDQHFTFPITEGVLIVDLLPLVRRDFKLANYKLKTVSTTFLGDTKDPITPQDLFRAYETLCLRCDEDEGTRQMVEVGKYCLQDADLVLRLFGYLQTWVGLCEMARICQVSFWSLYTQGQQIKVFSQIYRYCREIQCVVDPPATPDILPYTGAHVFPPQPGIYSWVVPFDFASLYPTTIIAYNIDYSTFIPESIWDKHPDPETYHAIDWEEHTCCTHDPDLATYTPATRPSYTFCGKRAFRFLKEPKGVLPTLLETLLRQRKETRKEMKALTDSPEDRALYEVLDKRQLAYKVSANSAYGAMGVSRGYLPFMPGAMCTTAMGRFNIMKAATHVQEKYGASLIYGDTDSIYVHFPGITNAKELWDHAVSIEGSLLSLFPPPMKLAFEEKLYKKFLILTKKRYMALTCDETGIVDKKLTIRGVLLARRDNCAWVRKLYELVVRGLMASCSMQEILDMLSGNILDVMRNGVPLSQFIVTKLVGSTYVIQPLVADPKKRAKRLKDLGIDAAWYDTEDRKIMIDPRCRCPGCAVGGGSGGPGDRARTIPTGLVSTERWILGIERFFRDLFEESTHKLRLTFQNQSRLTGSEYLSMIRESTLAEWSSKTRMGYFEPMVDSTTSTGVHKTRMCMGVLEVLKMYVAETPSLPDPAAFPVKQTLVQRGWNPIMGVLFQELVRSLLQLDTDHEVKITLPLTMDQLRKYLIKEAFNKRQREMNHCRGKCPCGPCKYYQRSLPAHVQLCMKMQRRGNLVPPGTRLEYVVVENPDPKAKLFDRLEDPVYTTTHTGVVKVDAFYYFHLLEFPMDQILNVCFKRPLFKEMVQVHQKYRVLMNELQALFRPRFSVLEDCIPYNEVLRFEQKV